MAIRDQIDALRVSLLGLGARRLAALVAVGVAIVAIIGVGSYYVSRAEKDVLYVGLTASDVSRIGAVLKETGIPFDSNSEANKIFVNRGDTARARMILAERGLPNNATAGYELFDKLGSLGLTSFMQNVTRVRALEGEIARTIEAMRAVNSARVHLVMADAGSFRREPQAATASVVVKPAGAEPPSAAAIRQIVASAVPGMKPDHVSVLSTDGTILSAGDDGPGVASGKMLDLEKQVSREINDNIRKTLTPVLGLGNFETSVTVRLNLDRKQINETAFDPESKAERSTRTVKESSNSQNTNQKWNISVEQNIPTDQQNTKPSDQSKRASERKEETTNYEVSSKSVTTQSEGYRVENIAVAVVLNRKPLLAAADSAKTAPDEQIRVVERLVSSAAGLDSLRGDKATVVALDFAGGNEFDQAPSPTFWDHVMEGLGSYVIAAALLISTILFVAVGLRPSLRMILENKPRPAPQIAADKRSTPVLETVAATVETSDDAEGPPLPTPGAKKNSPLKSVEKAIAEDEEKAAAVLIDWIREG
ncbi:flagellar M-ring protein FliF [Rhodomicrobium vannielii ATCC 17100]|uniref:flagellar basal-body MS-ring/collar protein FliF n=1 Tax=Rhodomicrobium vannielii TaxID=1069 RepID=UPI0019197047|nr:flagellar basal-body MS-ring/collar protein FliF [Rhodomicrobium vannielii]MBJ7535906.1 flagellar M-ring protein FliF [Rhodomicrobium vannielii ATCC 17100]